MGGTSRPFSHGPLHILPPTALLAQPELFTGFQLTVIQCPDRGLCTPLLELQPPSHVNPHLPGLKEFAVDWALDLWLRKAWLPP